VYFRLFVPENNTGLIISLRSFAAGDADLLVNEGLTLPTLLEADY